MSYFQQALGNAKLAIVSLCIALCFSFLLNVVLGVLLYLAPKHMTVFVPPTIPSGGFETKANQISKAMVYSFAYSTLTHLYSWSGNGESAFLKNIEASSAYLTKPFENVLKAQAASMNAQGFLVDHSQISFGVDGQSYDPRNVKYLGHGLWLVHLSIRSVNYVNDPNANAGFGSAHVASDAETSFVLKVSQFPMISGYNTSGLVLSGFALSPKVVKVYE